jgi:hypothetical protein
MPVVDIDVVVDEDEPVTGLRPLDGRVVNGSEPGCRLEYGFKEQSGAIGELLE